jgi:hypothetical protein
MGAHGAEAYARSVPAHSDTDKEKVHTYWLTMRSDHG